MGFSRQEYWSGLPLPSPRIYSGPQQFQKLPQENVLRNQGKYSFSSVKEFCLEIADPFLGIAPQFIALHVPEFILRIVFTFLSTFFSTYEKSIREYANLRHQAIFLSCFPLRESQRPGMYFKSQAITCCLIQVDSSSEIQLSQNFVLISFASSQLYVKNHIHNYFPDMPVSLDILPIRELIKHKQASSSFVAFFPLSHFVNLKWSTRQYLKIFRDVITGKELPQSCFNCFFPFKAILRFIFYQLFMRSSYLFLSPCKSQNFWILCIPRRRQWHPTPVLLPGKSHGRRSLVGCSPWGCEKSDTIERLHFHFSLSCIGEGNGNPLQCFCLENPRDGGAWWAAVYGVAQSRTRLK